MCVCSLRYPTRKAHVPYYDDIIYWLTAIWFTSGGSSIVHMYTQTIHRKTQLTTLVGRFSGIRSQSGQIKINDELSAQKLSPNWEECGPCPVCELYSGLCLTTEEKSQQNLSHVLSSVACPDLRYSPSYLENGKVFEKRY
jgi:hypothetical protein